MSENSSNQNSGINKDIGRRLRMARLDAQLTPEQLGEKVHCSGRNITNMETGRTEAPATLLYLISQSLRQPIPWFFQDAGPVPNENDPELFSECLRLLEQLYDSSALSSIRDVLQLAIDSE